MDSSLENYRVDVPSWYDRQEDELAKDGLQGPTGQVGGGLLTSGQGSGGLLRHAEDIGRLVGPAAEDGGLLGCRTGLKLWRLWFRRLKAY